MTSKLFTLLISYSLLADASVLCGSFTTCSACNAHPECGYCQDAADSFVDPTANLGGWVFRQNGLNGANSHNALKSALTGRMSRSSHADAYERLRKQAAADASLFQLQPPSHVRPLQHHGRLLQQQEESEGGLAPPPTSANVDAMAMSLLQVSSGPPASSGRGGVSTRASVSHLSDATPASHALPRDPAAEANADAEVSQWASVFASGGFCVNATVASASASCADLRVSLCDCDGVDITAIPQCHAVVDELRRPVLIAGLAFLAAAVVVGAVLAVDMSWRQDGGPRSRGGCRGKS